MNDQWARSARPLVSSSKTNPCQFSSVQLRRSVRALITDCKQYATSRVNYHKITTHKNSFRLYNSELTNWLECNKYRWQLHTSVHCSAHF